MSTNQVIPIFRTNFSIGKSILTLDDPSEVTEGGADSIFQITQENNLKELFIVESSLSGFPEFFTKCEKFKLKPIFGLKQAMRNSAAPEDEQSEHYVVIVAKNHLGCKLLNKISSFAECEYSGFIDYQNLKRLWNEDHLKLVIPFYDSFLFKNNFTFANAVPDLSFSKPTCFIEHNSLAFDGILAKKVHDFAVANQLKTVRAKSIYYKNRKDIEAFMTYKMICDRKFAKNRGIDKPELPHFASAEFCFESWKEQNNE
jgi:DNA polymerase III alpha subunit